MCVDLSWILYAAQTRFRPGGFIDFLSWRELQGPSSWPLLLVAHVQCRVIRSKPLTPTQNYSEESFSIKGPVGSVEAFVDVSLEPISFCPILLASLAFHSRSTLECFLINFLLTNVCLRVWFSGNPTCKTHTYKCHSSVCWKGLETWHASSNEYTYYLNINF